MITTPWCYFVVDENEGTQLDMEGMTTIDMEGMVVTIYGSLRTNAPIMKGKLSAVAKIAVKVIPRIKEPTSPFVLQPC